MIELHLHIDGSFRPSTIMALADEEGIPLPTRDLEKLTAEHLVVPENCQDLTEALKRFELPVKVLSTPEAIRRVTYELAEDLALEGYEHYAELRFAPQYATRTGYTQEDFIEAARLGLKQAMDRYSHFKGSLILCCMRGDDNEEANKETIRLTARYLDQLVCGADLAGAEGLFPTENFAEVFALAKKLDIPYTIHAGEAGGADSVRTALKMGAARIGHGVHAIDDPELVRELAKNKTPLEVNFTSNCQCRCFPTPGEHPFGRLYEAGVHVTVNTDNRTISGLTLAEEVKRIKTQFGFTEGDIQVMQEYAKEAAFTNLA
jgi:adenosine deaminase